MLPENNTGLRLALLSLKYVQYILYKSLSSCFKDEMASCLVGVCPGVGELERRGSYQEEQRCRRLLYLEHEYPPCE